MKNKHHYLSHLATLFLLLTLLVVFVSWICDVYGVSVADPHGGEPQRIMSLLSSEGLRWSLRNIVSNFTNFPPLGWGIVILFGVGIIIHSGCIDAIVRSARHIRLSHRERRSLALAVVVELVYILLVLLSTFSPWGIFLSIAGGLEHSPFLEGLLFLISFGIGLVGMVYGFASGRYRNDKDVAAGMAYLMRLQVGYLVVIFFAAQFFAALSYSHINNYLLHFFGLY
ncbi:MAG: AbgT family transporter [Prevotellaceae bacterium]|jgi:aminobenzoyl-glutamate transport protein|nr:AbgT family transporter [Prevotellaceae bacterium]